VQTWRITSVEEKMEARPILWAKAESAVEGAGWRWAQFSGLKSDFTNSPFSGLKDSFGGKVATVEGEMEAIFAAFDTSRF